MLQTVYIREHKKEIIERLSKRNFAPAAIVETILETDNKRREIQAQNDDLLAQQNSLAKQIGELFKSGKAAEANALKEKSAALKEQSVALTAQLSECEEQLRNMLLQLPNAPHQSVKAGKSAEDNEVMESFGEIPVLHANALPHWDLADKYDLIDFKLGVKVTGAGFPVYKGKGARLQRALINFFLDQAIHAGYAEVQPPHLVNEDSGYGTGQLPDKEGQMYHVGIDNLYLIPTAEVPITNLHRDVIYKPEDLPIKQTGYTPCFRREAGSYGKDVKGLNRLHQFDKVEIVQISLPEKSYETLEEMRSYVAALLKKLELPFRVLKLCGGDMGFASAMTYDMEVFSAAQQRWLEVSSVSNFEAFQANRLKLRYKDGSGKTQLCHTLNGSALALPRIVAALLENNQDEKGIKIPPALQPYTGFDRIE